MKRRVRTPLPWRQRANLQPQLAAEVIGISRRQVFGLIKRQVFRPLRQGRTVLIPVWQVNSYLNDLEQRAKQAMPLSPEDEERLGRLMEDFGMRRRSETRDRRSRRAAGVRRDRA